MFSINIVGRIDGYFVFFIFVIICYNKKKFFYLFNVLPIVSVLYIRRVVRKMIKQNEKEYFRQVY